MVSALRRAGAVVRYDNYAGVGHVVSPSIPPDEWLRFCLDARRPAGPPPPDPLDAFQRSPMETVTRPPRHALRLRPDEELAHPQDNLLRAGSKLHLAWRAATGQPASARFALIVREKDPTAVTAVLIPDHVPAPRSLLVSEVLPGSRAVRTLVACGPTWEDLQREVLRLRRELGDGGYRLSGTLEAVLLKLSPSAEGRRFWEVFLELE
jgi:hypothetical protein